MRNVSKIFQIILICVMCIFVFGDKYAFAQRNIGLSGKLIIRQEVYKNGAVVVSRPSLLDIEIANIIRINNINSFEDYTKWLEKNIEYREDDEQDDWVLPEDMLKRKWGDCEDYAFLNAAFLRVFGYQSTVLALGGFRRSHAICVFKEDGYYLWLDNSELRKTKERSIINFSKQLFMEYGCTSLLELNFDTKEYKTLFTR